MSSVWTNNLKISIFGESHGKAIGSVIDNLPPGEEIDFDEVLIQMKRRAPGLHAFSTKRKEDDMPEVLSGILNEYGPDSMIGRMASVICASTETTFYCMAVYFAKTRVKAIKKAAIGAVIGDLAGICAATFVLRVLGM